VTLGTLCVVLWTVPARGEAPFDADACVAQLSDDQVAIQLALIHHSFADQRKPAALWWTGWTAFNLFNVGFGSYKFATAHTRLAYDSWLVSVIGAGMFVASAALLPLPGMYGYRRLSYLPDDTPNARRIKLVRGLELLEKSAYVEKLNSNWGAHLGAVVYATLSTSYVWIRNRNADSGKLALALSLQFATSILVAELTFASVPRRARRDLQKIRTSVCSKPREREHAPKPSLQPSTREARASFSVQLGLTAISLVCRF
jgi:hypothetical protein